MMNSLDMEQCCPNSSGVSLSRDKIESPIERVSQALRALAPLPLRELHYLETRLRLLELGRGEALTRAGEIADCFGFVVSGLIRKRFVTPAGRAVVRGFGAPGSWVGAYASLLTGQASYLAVEAVLDSDLVVLDWSEMNTLYRRHAAWQEIGRKIAEALVLEREQRAHELLVLSARERYLRFCDSHRALLPHIKGYEIASYLGITPVSLSRLKARLARPRAAQKPR
ncbi:MAG TPA: Crp/Fnr family transcriptional regulator [Polyangiaceae bacterium]|nr:Crp/Fnr family transcriptional regulator [Polyangiaceae bacterium]